MFENLINIFKKNKRGEEKTNKDTAKERLHLVLMQDRANVSADFLGMMKQEIIEVIKKYIDVEEEQIDVKLTNKMNSDGTTGAPALYANIPIKSIKNESRKFINTEDKESNETPSKTETKVETVAEKTEKVEENKAEEPKKEEAKKVENKKVETKKAETKKTETKKADAKKEAKADKKEDKSKEKETVKEEKAQVEPKAIFFSNVTDKK